MPMLKVMMMTFTKKSKTNSDLLVTIPLLEDQICKSCKEVVPYLGSYSLTIVAVATRKTTP